MVVREISETRTIGEFTGADWLMILTGWLFVISAIAAWYTASVLMLEEAAVVDPAAKKVSSVTKPLFWEVAAMTPTL